MITRLTRNSIGHEFKSSGSSNFCTLHLAFAAVEPKRGKYKMSSSKLIWQCGHCLHKEGGSVVKALCMRNEDDINTAHDMKSICRAALLNNNAPDSELYWTRVRVFGEQQFLLTTEPPSYTVYYNYFLTLTFFRFVLRFCK